MSWNKRWMDLAKLVSTWSKDRSSQVGAVIVDNRNVLLSIGWNGFPRGVNDDIEKRHERPIKYKWFEHAERNAIYNAATKGIPLLDSTMIIPWFPCADCARGIIQSGIKKLICVEPNWNDLIYKEDFAIALEMFTEAKIEISLDDSVPSHARKEEVK